MRFRAIATASFFTISVVAIWLSLEIHEFLHRGDPCEPRVLLRTDWILKQVEAERYSKPGRSVLESCAFEDFHYGTLKQPVGN